MPLDDAAFGNDIDTYKEALIDAVSSLSLMEIGVIEDEGLAAAVLGRCEQFRQVGAISGGTDLIKQGIKNDVLPILSEYDSYVSESLATTIREKLTAWYGPAGTLPFIFKTDYLSDLSSCLGSHYEVFVVLADIVESLSAVLDDARQQVLDIMDSTIVALEGATAGRSSGFSPGAVAVIAGLATVATFGTGVVAMTVAGVLTAAGSAMASSATQVSGGSPLEILDDAGSKLLDVQSNLREAVGQLEIALDEVINVTSGPHSGDFAGPDLGEMLQNFGTHET